MSGSPLVELSQLLAEHSETPPLDAVLTGTIPIVAKVRFVDGGIEFRASTDTKTDLILVRRGDLLVSGINALKGAVGLHPKGAASEAAATIHYSAYGIDEHQAYPEYMQEYLRSPAFRRRATSQLPGGIKTELKPTRLLSVKIPLPPLPEQLARLSMLQTRRALSDALVQRRRRSSVMILGRRVTVGIDTRRLLSARLRDYEADITSNFEMGVLGDALIERLRHGPSFPCAADASGVAVLMPSATTGFGLDTTRVQFGVGNPAISDLDYVEPGDIIFARGNKPDQVGNCGLYEGEPDLMTFANLFMRIRVDHERFEAWFAQYWLMTPGVRTHVRRFTKGTGPSIQKINGTGVRSIPFPKLVPPNVQRWWISHLDSLRRITSAMEELEVRQASDLDLLEARAVDDAFSDL